MGQNEKMYKETERKRAVDRQRCESERKGRREDRRLVEGIETEEVELV